MGNQVLHKVSVTLIIAGVLMMLVSTIGLAGVFCYRAWIE